MKKFLVALFTMLKNKPVVQAFCLIIGSVAMIFGETVSFNDGTIEAVVTISGAILTALSYGSALVTESK
jgi:hypothetical protein